MKLFNRKLAGLLPILLALAACGSSPPSRHYVLTSPATEVPSAETPSLGIGPISIPEYLDRNSMVYNRQGNELKFNSSERWAEPLEDGITRVLSVNLASLVATQNVRFFPWNSRRAPDYGIKVRVLSMDADGSMAQLAAEWLLYKPGTAETVKRRIARIQQPLPTPEPTPAQAAQMYSDLLYQLSEVIAKEIIADQQQPAATAAGS